VSVGASSLDIASSSDLALDLASDLALDSDPNCSSFIESL